MGSQATFQEAQHLCTRIAMMKAGRIVALDSTANLLQRFGDGTTNLEDAFMRVMKEAA